MGETEVVSRTDLLVLVLDYGDACALAAAYAEALDQRGDDETGTLELRVQEKEDSRKEIESRLRALIMTGALGPPRT